MSYLFLFVLRDALEIKPIPTGYHRWVYRSYLRIFFFWYKNLLATGSSYLRVLKQLSLSCQTICRRKPAYLQRLQVWTRLPSWNVILFVNFTDENALVSVWQSYLQYNGCNIILYRFCLHIFKAKHNFEISCVHYPTVLETAASTRTK